ncbi:MAG: hypothetical protein K6F26_07505 [Lachnospiraceae bacterium]|nr:hypothetical protein [Lachnospiraceae bacterium]
MKGKYKIFKGAGLALTGLLIVCFALSFAYAAGDAKGDPSGEYDKNYRVTTVKSVRSGDAVVGAVLQIVDKNGAVIEEWTSGAGEHPLNARLIAGATYTLREKSVPAGYVKAADVTFTVSKDGSVDAVDMKDDWTKVTVLKYSNATHTLVAGAVLQIIDADNGAVVYEWTTDGTGTRFEGFLTAGKKYILREKAAPAGYTVAADVAFTVSASGAEDIVTMYNDYTKVTIRKVAK